MPPPFVTSDGSTSNLKRKRLIQPVLPALPQLPLSNKPLTSGKKPVELPANDTTSENDDHLGRSESKQALAELSNGLHEYSAPVQSDLKTEADNATTPATSVSPGPDSASSHQTTSPGSSARLQSMTPPSLASFRAIEGGSVDFPTKGFGTRSPRQGDRQIMFRAPTESPSPSRATKNTQPDLLFGFSSEMNEHDQFDGSTDHNIEIAEQSHDSGSNMGSPSVQHPLAAELPERPIDVSQNGTAMISSTFEEQSGVIEKKSDLILKTEQEDAGNEDHIIKDPPHTSFAATELADVESQQGIIKSQILHVAQLSQLATDPSQMNDRGIQHTALTPDRTQFAPALYLPLYPTEPATSINSISNHLSHQFLTKEWVDWAIEVGVPLSTFSPVAYHVHGVIIARSPTLLQKMRHQLLSGTMNNVITIAPDRYIQPPAFEEALRYLYTDELLTKSDVRERVYVGTDPESKQSRDFQLDFILSYWMAGSVLGMKILSDQGYKLVGELMGWDILELTLHEALTLQKQSKTAAAVDSSRGSPITPRSSAAASAGSPWKNTGATTPDQVTNPRSSLRSPVYQYPALNLEISRALKRIVYNFICSHIDITTFVPERSTILRSYLPGTREYSGNSRHASNPALSAIRFGAMPLNDDEESTKQPNPEKSSSPQQITSAVLVNLEYPDFNDFCLTVKEYQIPLETFDGQLRDWISRVVEERETRRMKVLASKTISNQERTIHENKWNVVGWEEKIVVSDSVGGWDLVRTWKGFALPGRQ